MWSSVGAGFLNGAITTLRQGYPVMSEVMLLTSMAAGLGGLAGYTLGCHFETTTFTVMAFQDHEVAQSFIKKVLENRQQPLEAVADEISFLKGTVIKLPSMVGATVLGLIVAMVAPAVYNAQIPQ